MADPNNNQTSSDQNSGIPVDFMRDALILLGGGAGGYGLGRYIKNRATHVQPTLPPVDTSSDIINALKNVPNTAPEMSAHELANTDPRIFELPKNDPRVYMGSITPTPPPTTPYSLNDPLTAIRGPAVRYNNKVYPMDFYKADKARELGLDPAQWERGFITHGGQFVDPRDATSRLIKSGRLLPSNSLASRMGADDIDYWAEPVMSEVNRGNTDVHQLARQFNTDPLTIQSIINRWGSYKNPSRVGNRILNKNSQTEE